MQNKQYGKAVDFSDTGYIYIVSNEEGKYKIGYTKKSPYDRMKELSSATGVDKPFNMCWFKLVENAPLAEEMIHKHLFRHRINKNREFFKVDLNKAISVAEIVSETVQERAFSSTPNDYKVKQQEKNLIVPKSNYSNPRYVELIKYLKENEGTLFTERDIAKELKISVGGVEKLLGKLEEEKTKILHKSDNGKFGFYVGFKKPQLDAFAEEYPELDISELLPLFKKPEFKNKATPQSDKPKNQTYFYENPRFIEALKIFKILEKKEVPIEFMADKLGISVKGTQAIIDRIVKDPVDILIKNNETGHYSLNSELTEADWKVFDSHYPKMDIYKEVIENTNKPIQQAQKQRKPRPKP